MTLEQLEERLTALEKTVEELRVQRSGSNGSAPTPTSRESPLDEEEFIPGAEYPLVLNAPPKEVTYLRGVIDSIDESPRGLALSDAEWAALQLEDEDE